MLKFMLKNHLRFPLLGDSVVKTSSGVLMWKYSLPTKSVLASGSGLPVGIVGAGRAGGCLKAAGGRVWVHVGAD